MFKKVIDFLFKEETVEEVTPVEKPEARVAYKRPEPVEKQAERPNPVARTVVPEKTNEPTLTEAIRLKPIDLSQSVETLPRVKDETVKLMSEPVEYTFAPVISPIFGVDEKDQERVREKVKPQIPSKEVSAVRPVISPIFGTKKQATGTSSPAQSDTGKKTLSLDELLAPEQPVDQPIQEQLFADEDTLQEKES